MRKTLSDKGVAALKPRAARYAFPDPELRGHYVRVQPSGAKIFVTVASSPAGKQIWTTIGAADAMAIADARVRARDVLDRVRRGLPAVEARAETFGDVAANWIKRHVSPTGCARARKLDGCSSGTFCRHGGTGNSSVSGAATWPCCSIGSRTSTAPDRPIMC